MGEFSCTVELLQKCFVEFNGPVTLAGDTTVKLTSLGNTGHTIFSGSVDGAYKLIVSGGRGGVTFTNAVGSTVPLTSLEVSSLFSPITLGGNITTNGGNITFGTFSNVILTGDTVISTGDSLGGDISFSTYSDYAVDSDGISPRNLTLKAGLGNVSGNIFGAYNPLNNLNIEGNEISLNSAKTQGSLILNSRDSLSLSSSKLNAIEDIRLLAQNTVNLVDNVGSGGEFTTAAGNFFIQGDSGINIQLTKNPLSLLQSNGNLTLVSDGLIIAGRMGANTKSAIAALSIEQIRAIARQQNATLVEYAIVPDDDFKFRGKQRARESELLIWVVQPTGEVALRRVDLKHIWQHNLTLTDLVNASRCLDGGIYCKKQAIIIANLGKESNSRYIGLRKLHKFLIEPIADLLPKDPNAHVVFIPQESLFLVPFAALQNADSKYLIEQHTIITAPAIQVLDLTRKQKNRLDEQNRKPLQPLIIGNPIMPIVSQILGEPPEQLPNLAASEREAVEIAKLLKYKALIGAQATKAKVKQLLAQANVVHFATHGLLEYRSQKSSSSLEGLEVPGALALAPDDQDDGLLTANEIFDQHLVAELVVLSACDTGRGRITGDGVIGLSRAFISAGTPSLVVSLWVVPDASTAELMITFYQKLQTKLNKAQAP